jgi:hypothetical protein
MRAIGLLTPFIMLFLSASIQIKIDPRIDRTFVWKSLLALGVFAVHCLIGFGVISLLGFVLATPDQRDAMVGFVIGAWFGWLGLGAIGLMRYAPRTTEPPKWMMKFSAVDVILLVLIAACLIGAVSVLFR